MGKTSIVRIAQLDATAVRCGTVVLFNGRSRLSPTKYHFERLFPTITRYYFCSFEAPGIPASEISGVH